MKNYVRQISKELKYGDHFKNSFCFQFTSFTEVIVNLIYLLKMERVSYSYISFGASILTLVPFTQWLA